MSCVRDACRFRARIFHAQRRSRHFVFDTHIKSQPARTLYDIKCVAALLIRPRKVTQEFICTLVSPQEKTFLREFRIFVIFSSSLLYSHQPSALMERGMSTYQTKVSEVCIVYTEAIVIPALNISREILSSLRTTQQ